MSRVLTDAFDDARKKIEQLPVGEPRAKLTIRLQQAASTLARRISAAAKKESK
jgi:hypothetical protein